MRLSIKNNSDKMTAIFIVCLAVLLVLSLVANSIIGRMAWYFYTTQRTITTPMFYNQPFKTSLVGTDWTFMNMSAMSFVTLRLNVTPETIDGQHKALLGYVDSDLRPALKKLFDVEAQRIKELNISSAFYMEDIHAVPETGDILIRGKLKSNTPTGPLDDALKKYRIRMSYYNGSVQIVNFTELPYEEPKGS
ncbi:TraE/TraK family type IV conjugative transfer system protein [Serratia plymuthica]|uniref:Protein TraE n=1 Tax=Serratia plymuthica TaxID=82996 RepID=A0A318P329_SERPL|nr:TraE/TraK family type IV conjugative transfer system protein [Serratia plymuthica]AGO57695.1 protein TraE [Serratia plymuthica 4Rx13]PYD36583.1 protein TraE [Serratia plymuthica]